MKYYDSISQGYSELYGEEQMRKASIIRDYLEISKDKILLDVGCGSAIYFGLFDCAKIGIDSSLDLLKQGMGGLFINAKAEALPFKDNSFDFVISVTAIHNFKSPLKGLEEMRRVAKQKVIISVLKSSAQFASIKEYCEKNFIIKKVLEEDKDLIFVLEINKI